jgi:hypothetical protein
MKTFKCRGTLGDSYIINCIYHDLMSKEEVLIKQCWDYAGTAVDAWTDPIQQIYSLMPKIHVDFVNREEFDSCRVPRIWPSPARASKGKMICPMTPHPTFTFPEFPDLPDLPEKYIVMSPRGGKSSELHRQIGFPEVNSILHAHRNTTFVLVGHNPEFTNYRHRNVINLINKTSVLEAMGIVARAPRFIGVQGLMAYVALSQRIPSVVYTKSIGYDKAFRSRLLPEWLELCLILKTYRKENQRAFIKTIQGAL